MLSPLSAIYGSIVSLRNAAYDRGLLKVHDLGARTISIGNLTVGGTGKTPLVIDIARHLIETGETVCVLTRGYGRRSSGRVLVSDGRSILANANRGGDEAVEIASALNAEAIVIADADRVAAARWAIGKFGVTRFVLDDGFQHRRAHRDVDILCIDATAPSGDGTKLLGDGSTLPGGRLREKSKGIRRADAVVITRSDLSDDVEPLIADASQIHSTIPIFRSRLSIRTLVDRSASVSHTPSDIGQVFAFCGLGNPEAFYGSLRNLGIDVCGTLSFRDHHYFTDEDIAAIDLAAKQNGAEFLVTTRKDAVKINTATVVPLLVAEGELIIERRAEFYEML